MMKPWGYIPSNDELAKQKNWRVHMEGTKFINFTDQITTTNITNRGTNGQQGWCQLYGPMAYYYIRLVSAGGDMTSAGSGTIDGIPFGPPSVSGLKSTIYKQFLEAVDVNGVPLANQKATLVYNGTAPRINLINPIATSEVYVYGWFFRDGQ